MKVFVIGAHGQVGALLVDTLIENDCAVVAGYRDPVSQAPENATPNFTPVRLDLGDDIETLANILAGSDAVVFAAGSRGKDLLAVDLDGAVKAVEATKQAGIQRFVMLSALHVEDRSQWAGSLNNYYIAKYYADEWLMRSSLDYVIVKPTTLTNAPGTGTISLEPTGHDTISRQDVATVLARVVAFDNLHRTAIKLANGSIPIAQAL